LSRTSSCENTGDRASTNSLARRGSMQPALQRAASRTAISVEEKGNAAPDVAQHSRGRINLRQSLGAATSGDFREHIRRDSLADYRRVSRRRRWRRRGWRRKWSWACWHVWINWQWAHVLPRTSLFHRVDIHADVRLVQGMLLFLDPLARHHVPRVIRDRICTVVATQRPVILRNTRRSLQDRACQEARNSRAVDKAEVEEESFLAVASFTGRVAEADFRLSASAHTKPKKAEDPRGREPSV